MIKVSVCKNHEGVEYHSIDIGNLKRVSNEMYEANEDRYNSGKVFFGQCMQCAKGIKHRENSFQIICDYNTEIYVKRSHYEIAKSSPGFMECFDIGPECARRVKKACKEAGIDWKDYIFPYKKLEDVYPTK